MDIGQAVSALREGSRVGRAGWNGKGMWLALVFNHNASGEVETKDEVYEAVLADYVVMRTADDRIVPWLCSQTDLLAMDWEVVKD